MIDTIPTTVRIRRRCRVHGARGRLAARSAREDPEAGADAENPEPTGAEASVSDSSASLGVGLVTGAP